VAFATWVDRLSPNTTATAVLPIIRTSARHEARKQSRAAASADREDKLALAQLEEVAHSRFRDLDALGTGLVPLPNTVAQHLPSQETRAAVPSCGWNTLTGREAEEITRHTR